jgi:hypothetical protein
VNRKKLPYHTITQATGPPPSTARVELLLAVRTRVLPTRSNPNRLFAAERGAARFVGNTGSSGRLYSTVLEPLKPQKVDKWESDSDSDESEDENDPQDLMV